MENRLTVPAGNRMMADVHATANRCSPMLLAVCLLVLLLLQGMATAGTPITLYQSLAGNLDYVATGGTLRAESNAGDACALNSGSTAMLSGIPAGATIRAAYLYWAGSGSSPDNTVTIAGSSVTADRTFTETFSNGGTDYDFFSGFKDVTSLVAARGNGSYSFSGLSVNNGAPHCAVAAVLSGWSLLVVYEHSSEPLRVVNVFDGFRYFRGGDITLTPGNFIIPSSGINGTHAVLTWEGDVENSASLGGFSEALTFNGSSLTDSYNPVGNQFNSTINVLGSNSSYGVDLDIYDVSSLLSPGATTSTSVYSSGADLVLLSMEVLSVSNTAVADLSISKTHSGSFVVGQQGSFTLQVSNNGPSTETGSITVSDTLPAGLGYVSASGTGWNCTASGQDVSCSHAGPLASGAGLPAITLVTSVLPAAAPAVNNTATVSGSVFDNQSANNSSTDTVTVLQPDLSTSTKSVVDLNGGDVDPGDVLRYTIELLETGGVAASAVSVSDSVPAHTGGLSVVALPAGANNLSSTTLLDITGISVPANGSVQLVFDVTVSGTASPGDSISNTATVSNPGGPGATPSAPTLTVSASQLAASGNKHLYLGNTSLSRIVPGALADITVSKGSSRSWTLTPALATALTIDGSSGQIPVTLVLGETGTGSMRDLTIRLASSALGTIATLSLGNVDLNPTVTASYALALSSTADRVLPAGSTLTLTITNNTGGGGSRNIVITPNGSFVRLPAKTVINVDSLGFYSAAYPGGAQPGSVTPGSVVYVRSVVSDPFGSFDITSADVTLLDASGSVVINAAAMTQVADSGSATRTFEYAYTIPAAAADGNWTARVVAHEGSEGTITHQRSALLQVSSATLVVVKSVQTVSDPLHGSSSPYNIPGAVLLYTIQVSNSGAGSTDMNSVLVTDAIPQHAALQVSDIGASGSGPVLFVDGTPASGLVYSYQSAASLTDDLDFSLDGSNWSYTPVADAGGLDKNVRYIRVRPRNAMAGNSGSGAPSFRLRFRVVVQ